MTVLLVMAKAPVPGAVKTRLCPPITPEQAARIAAAALLDTMATVAATPGVTPVLALAGRLGDGVDPAALTAAAAGWLVLPQRGGDLGARLAHAHADVARVYPGRPVLQIGMDTPQLTAGLLGAATRRLARSEAVLGGAVDGGWWALGLRDPRRAAVLRAVPMSTPRTARLTRTALAAQGLRAVPLPRLRDVDEWSDALAVAAGVPGSRFAREVAAACSVPATEPIAFTGQADSAHSSRSEPASMAGAGPVEPGPPLALRAVVDGGCGASGAGTLLAPAAPVVSVGGGATVRTGTLARPEGGFGSALLEPLTPRWLVCGDGRVSPLPVSRWYGEAEDALRVVVTRCTGPTLDVGCGPGRLTAALVRAGRTALGVDISATAVRLTRARGATAVHRCVFSPLPREGGWTHVLLIDGNIGIGGDPAALLRRCAVLLNAGGTAIVEMEPGGVGLWRGHAWVCSAPAHGPTSAGARFRWARVGVGAVSALSRDAGLVVREVFRHDGRCFAELAKRSRHHRPAGQSLGAGPVESRTTSR